MKKNQMSQAVLFVLAISFSAVSMAQSNASTVAPESDQVKGKNFLNAGIGIGTFGFTGTGALPITASFEHGFANNISAGIAAGIASTTYASYWKYSYVVVGLRGSYHFNELLKLNNDKADVYGGITIFYRGYSVKYTGTDAFLGKTSAGDVAFAIHVGGHYYFAKNIGAFAELGYGISPLQLGLSLKF